MSHTLDPVSPALDATVARFMGTLRRVGIQFRLAEPDLDELAQEIRVRLWKALQSDERIRSVPASYVHRVARSAAVDLFRRRRARREEPLDQQPATVVFQAPAADSAGLEELTRALETALGTMLPARRAPVRMHLAGYGREEIGAMLGWSEAKTRNLLYRGLEDLRQRLTALGIGPEGMP